MSLKLPISIEPEHGASACAPGDDAAAASPAATAVSASAVRIEEFTSEQDTRAVLDLDRLRQELEAACADAGIALASLVVWVVDATWAAGTTPLAYLHPEGVVRPGTVRVFRAVGAVRADASGKRTHRLALWRGLPGLPDTALGPMIRHELEHARRWELSGPRFFDADDLLREAVGA